MGVEERRAKAQKESKVILDYTHKAIARLTYLKRFSFACRTLAQVEDDVANSKAQMDYWKEYLAPLLSKEQQYLQELSNHKVWQCTLSFQRSSSFFNFKHD
ncbi:hypothetical protein GIB67_030722 [Kingdonia uniflora]|uniref:Uncharacterized protein n=1 Tax=Kingdonia uniflora TaxID=39325 RepID=A0A7J7L331_9MAGN|nr:hypothetical protein GIB67_030722 [Kingdonia uniflora]